MYNLEFAYVLPITVHIPLWGVHWKDFLHPRGWLKKSLTWGMSVKKLRNNRAGVYEKILIYGEGCPKIFDPREGGVLKNSDILIISTRPPPIDNKCQVPRLQLKHKWATSCKKVRNGWSHCHTKRRMGAHGHDINCLDLFWCLDKFFPPKVREWPKVRAWPCHSSFWYDTDCFDFLYMGKCKKNGPKVWHGGQKTNLIWPHLFLPHPKHQCCRCLNLAILLGKYCVIVIFLWGFLGFTTDKRVQI